MFWLSISFLILSAAIIAYQDFTARMISLWLILVFGIANTLFYLSTGELFGLIENCIFCVCYLLFMYGVILLYFYIKNKKFEKILDTQFGWGDVLVMLFIGIGLDAVSLIYFFSMGLISSLLLSLLFFRQKKGIPLAGLLVLNYLVYLALSRFL